MADYAFGLVFVSLSSLTLLECTITVVINSREKTLRDKPSTVFANSLSGSIALLSLISLFCNIYFLVFPYQEDILWPCIALKVCVRYLHSVSYFNLTCLALDRYLSICWPLHYSLWLTKVRCCLLSVVCWTTPAFLILLPCAADLPTICTDNNFTNFYIAYIVVYTLGASTTFLLYILVVWEFGPDSRTQAGGDNNKIQRLLRIRTARSAMAVISLYLLFSLPHKVFILTTEVLGYDPGDQMALMRHIFHVINRIHLFLFLPVYAWANAEFHLALKEWRMTLVHWVLCYTQPEL